MTRNPSRARPANWTTLVATLACAPLLWVAGVAPAVATQNITRTVWDGIFSEEQAKRGEGIYLDECSRCHADNLSGGDFGPAVVGTGLWGRFDGKPIGELFLLIRDTMPQDNPGRLSAAQTADVLAFLMRRNGFPAGAASISSDPAALTTITVVAKP